MEQEEFLESLENLKIFAKSNGDMVTKEDILDCLGHDIKLDDKQWQMIAGYLKVNKIKVLDLKLVDHSFEEMIDAQEKAQAEAKLKDDVEEKPQSQKKLADEKRLLDMYMADLSASMTPLSRASEGMILQDVCDKDVESRNVLIQNYLFKVVDWMKSYEGQGIALMDLIQEANMVVMDELNRRDWMKKLDAFDVMDSVDVNAWINLSERLDEYLISATDKVVRALIEEQTQEKMTGNKVVKIVNQVNDAANKAYAEYGRKVTPEELAEFMHEPLADVLEAIQLSAERIENVIVPE